MFQAFRRHYYSDNLKRYKPWKLVGYLVFFTVTLTDFDVSCKVSWKLMRERKENKLRRHYVISTS